MSLYTKVRRILIFVEFLNYCFCSYLDKIKYFEHLRWIIFQCFIFLIFLKLFFDTEFIKFRLFLMSFAYAYARIFWKKRRRKMRHHIIVYLPLPTGIRKLLYHKCYHHKLPFTMRCHHYGINNDNPGNIFPLLSMP